MGTACLPCKDIYESSCNKNINVEKLDNKSEKEEYVSNSLNNLIKSDAIIVSKDSMKIKENSPNLQIRKDFQKSKTILILNLSSFILESMCE